MQVIRFKNLCQFGELTHGFSTKEGGVSKGIYATMNLGLTRGDDRDAVMENFRRMAEYLEMPMERMVLAAQTHTTNVRIVTEQDMGKGLVKERDYEDVDGLITNIPGIPLVTFYADCVPLLFYDPVKKVIASSHSGWRGTVNRMGQATVRKMQEVFGCDSKDIYACIGPSICKDCYEVDETVANQFKEEFDTQGVTVYPKENTEESGKYLVDLQEANRLVLLHSGILPEHIEDAKMCTSCHSDLLFSHRKTNGQRGNLAAFIMMKEQ